MAHSDTAAVYRSGREEGFARGFAHASQAVFSYLQMAMPHDFNPQAQQFHLGLVHHLKFVLLLHLFQPEDGDVSTSPWSLSTPSVRAVIPTVAAPPCRLDPDVSRYRIRRSGRRERHPPQIRRRVSLPSRPPRQLDKEQQLPNHHDPTARRT